MHTADFLKSPDKHQPGGMVVLYGPVRFLKQAALNCFKKRILGEDEDDALGFTQFLGKDVELKTVLDELSTISMWGDQKLIVIEQADTFVSQYRSGLEKYLESPAKKSLLILDVNKWLKTTRLAKKVAMEGLPLECSELKPAALTRWLMERAEQVYEKKLSRDAAMLIADLAGSDLGLLDQELSKLTDLVGEAARITPDNVQSIVGGWKVKTTWEMLDAVRMGNMEIALTALDKLLVAGEAPQRIMGAISFQYRKIANATILSRQGMPLSAALNEAGVFYRDIDATSQYMRRIGRTRAEKIIQKLAEVDGNLKGKSALNERIQLEELLVTLGATIKAKV